MKLKIEVKEKEGKYVLINQYKEKKICENKKELIAELMHYRGDEELGPRVWELLRYYSWKEK